MAQNSKIEWTTHTGNLWWGCTEVHSGCDNCYARVLAHRWGQEVWGNDAPRREVKSIWSDLNRYQKSAEAVNEIHSVFVGSMMDIFEKSMPLVNTKMQTTLVTTGYLRDLLFKNISEGMYPNLKFLLLTKRPSNINKMIPELWLTNPPENVMFGTSPVNQETADKLIPQLLKVNGKKFLSVEPMLDEINLKVLNQNTNIETDCLSGGIIFSTSEGMGATGAGNKIDWVICGGESGHNKRPFNAEWARAIRGQCESSSTPFFMKQMDKIQEIPEDLLIRQFPI